MPAPKATKLFYQVPVLAKALDLLELLQDDNQPKTLEALHRHTKIPKTTVYRILKTFVHRGYLSQLQDGTYRQAPRAKKLRFGFGGQSSEMAFSNEVTESVRWAASAVGIDLLILDNQYDAATAIRNVEKFIEGRVDLIIEFQVEQEAAAIIADKIAEARIPLIAIDIPHPNSTFFGVDNYRIGMAMGKALAEYAMQYWDGKVDWILGLDLPEAGLLVQSRITGAFESLRAVSMKRPAEFFLRIDGRGMRCISRKLVSDFLRSHPGVEHILIVAANDTSALGAVDALREQRREKHAAIVGQDCIAEAVEEMRRRGTPLIGSVFHETGTYGPSLIDLSLSMLHGHTVAPYNYVNHRMVTRESVQAAIQLH